MPESLIVQLPEKIEDFFIEGERSHTPGLTMTSIS